MLIGLTGRAGAGKDTVYETLAELYGVECPVERRSFADPLYESAAAALGVTVDDLRAWKRDPYVKVAVVREDWGGDALRDLTSQSVRQFLQRYGTEAHRLVFHEDFWIDTARLRDHRGRIVAVTDVRFWNEAEAVQREGGVVVRVVGPDDGDAPPHASEEPLPDSIVDYVVNNRVRNDDRAYLRRQVQGLVMRVRRRNGEMP